MVSLVGLRTLHAVVETGSLRAAASRIGRTPSAVSMMLKQLEAEVGGALFAGDRKNLLSDLGTRVHQEAQSLLSHYDRASAAMISFAANRIGRCDVASVPSVASRFLPEAIARTRDRLGPFGIQVRDMDSRAVIEGVEDGSVEIGFCVLPHRRPGLVFEPLFHEPLDVVCRHDHPWVRRGSPVTWDEIARHDFIANGSVAAIASDRAAAMVEQSSLQARNITSLLAMVEAGLGVTVLPRLCGHRSGTAIAFLPLDDSAATRTVGWIRTTDRELLPATVTLVEEVTRVIRDQASTVEGGEAVPGAVVSLAGRPSIHRSRA